jgi:hypothetical protein
MSKLIRFDAGELTAGFTADEYRRRRWCVRLGVQGSEFRDVGSRVQK